MVWIVLGSVVFCAFILSLFSLRTLKRSKQIIHKDNKFKIPYGLWLLIISYILNAIGYLPHTLFWVDYLVRDLKFSTLLAGSSWAFFGIGAVLGSIGSGILADRIGIKNAHIVILFSKPYLVLSQLLPVICFGLTLVFLLWALQQQAM